MILFVADHHYETHCGRIVAEQLAADIDLDFYENDWSAFARLDDTAPGDLLVLNMIGGTCDVPAPDADTVAAVRRYCESGGSLLLLHGASAAFWQHDWWRPIVGFRWVRGDDPDGFASSVHPHAPCRVDVAKSRHPLCRLLRPMELPNDEIYTKLEQTCAAVVLMETAVQGRTWPMAWENRTPWGGRVLGFLPGHAEATTRDPALVANVRILIEDLSGDCA